MEESVTGCTGYILPSLKPFDHRGRTRGTEFLCVGVCVCVCMRVCVRVSVCVQNLKHSEATFALSLSLSPPLDLHSLAVQLLLNGSAPLLPCVGAPLDGQLDLLRDEGGPPVSRAAHGTAWPFLSFGAVSLKAGRGPAPLVPRHRAGPV